jgi:hypothetical protein
MYQATRTHAIMRDTTAGAMAHTPWPTFRGGLPGGVTAAILSISVDGAVAVHRLGSAYAGYGLLAGLASAPSGADRGRPGGREVADRLRASGSHLIPPGNCTARHPRPRHDGGVVGSRPPGAIVPRVGGCLLDVIPT